MLSTALDKRCQSTELHNSAINPACLIRLNVDNKDIKDAKTMRICCQQLGLVLRMEMGMGIVDKFLIRLICRTVLKAHAK